MLWVNPCGAVCTECLANFSVSGHASQTPNGRKIFKSLGACKQCDLTMTVSRGFFPVCQWRKVRKSPQLDLISLDDVFAKGGSSNFRER